MKRAKNKKQKKLLKAINKSLDLLDQGLGKEKGLVANPMQIPSLLEQSLKLCEQYEAQSQEPIRTVHHFGLPLDSPLLSSLATLPNTQVLADIHPNNNSFKDSISRKVINQYDDAEINTVDDEYRHSVFLSDLKQTYQQSQQIGQRLLICDNHCLSQLQGKPSGDLLTLLKGAFSLRSLIVVTDPVESYPVYCSELKTEAPPLSFDEYCQRILDFIQVNSELTVIRHEDFLADPEKVMGEIADEFELPFCDEFWSVKEVCNE